MGLYACGATFRYILPLPNFFSNSFVFKIKIEKEGLPRGSPAGLGGGGLRFKSRRPASTYFFNFNELFPKRLRQRPCIQLGSNYKPLQTFICARLLFRDRVQVNLAHDFRCGVPNRACKVPIGVPTPANIVTWLCLSKCQVKPEVSGDHPHESTERLAGVNSSTDLKSPALRGTPGQWQCWCRRDRPHPNWRS
jgi:hypothetical protein